MIYRWKTPPYPHQVRAVKKLLSTGYGGALLCEPRTGKTKVAIDYASILHQAGKVHKVIIVCPVSVIGVWEQEIDAHCPFPYDVIIWDREGRAQVDPTRRSSTRLQWLIVNFDAFSTPDRRSRKGRMAIRKTLRRWRPELMVLDESHRIKSPSAKKTYAIWSTAWQFGKSKARPIKCLIPYRVIMTGTPVTKKKKASDIYAQWKFLNPQRFSDLPTSDLFKDHFSKWTYRNDYPQWLGNRNIEELRARVAKDAFMVKRADCFDLPVPHHQQIPVELSSHTREVYDDMEREMLAKLANGEITTAQIKLVQALRLSQITSGLAKTDEGKLYAIGKEKLNVTRELLRDLFDADEKVVVAARFRGDLQRLAKLGQDLGVKTHSIRGGQGRRGRDKVLCDFREGSAPRLMLVQPQAASLGIDLSSASIMLWYSLTTSYVDFTQTCDRIALSNKPTWFMYLLAKDTIDESIYLSLQEDRDLAEVMLERFKSC